jgi:hypothetical protein
MRLRRRAFLRLLGYAALSDQVLPLTGAACAEQAAPPDSLAVTSSRNSKLGRWAFHSHLLYVPLALFREPPSAGVALSTTWKFLHSHELTLSQAQLAAIARGETVETKDASAAHDFAIALR